MLPPCNRCLYKDFYLELFTRCFHLKRSAADPLLKGILTTLWGSELFRSNLGSGKGLTKISLAQTYSGRRSDRFHWLKSRLKGYSVGGFGEGGGAPEKQRRWVALSDLGLLNVTISLFSPGGLASERLVAFVTSRHRYPSSSPKGSPCVSVFLLIFTYFFNRCSQTLQRTKAVCHFFFSPCSSPTTQRLWVRIPRSTQKLYPFTLYCKLPWKKH